MHINPYYEKPDMEILQTTFQKLSYTIKESFADEDIKTSEVSGLKAFVRKGHYKEDN